jgi:DNA-binding MarR family transcriptional regulator
VPGDTALSRAEVIQALGVAGAIAASGVELERAIEGALPSDLHGNHAILALVALEIEGPLRPARLAERTGLTSGGTTKLLDRLERRGLVTRVFGLVPGDRRGSTVELTSDGHDAVAMAAQALRACVPSLTVAATAVLAYIGSLEAAPTG